MRPTPTILSATTSCTTQMLAPNNSKMRYHTRALAQRVEVGGREVRLKGLKSELLRTLAAASLGRKSVAIGVQSSLLKWRARHNSNVRPLPSEGTIPPFLSLRLASLRSDKILYINILVDFLPLFGYAQNRSKAPQFAPDWLQYGCNGRPIKG